MSFIKRQTVTLTTDGSGNAVGYTEDSLNGKIHSISYVKTDFANGVDITITTEETAQTIWAEQDVNASKVVAPRLAEHSTAGVAALYASGGEAVKGTPVAISNERIKIAIAQGGDTKTGKFHILIE